MLDRLTTAGALRQDGAGRRQAVSVGVVMVAVYMVFLDVSIVLVALPSLQRGIGATFSQAEFVLSGYQLAYATLLFCGGHLGDRLGCRRAFVLGLAVFGGASAACGLAPGPLPLDVARVFEGAGAGILYPQMIPVLHAIGDEETRKRGVAAVTAAMGAGIVTGPVAGGLLIAAGIGGAANAWRPIFLINVPVALAIGVLARRALPGRVEPVPRDFDFTGLALLSVVVFAVVLPLVEAPGHGIGLAGDLSFATAGVVAAALLARNAARGRAHRPVLLERRALSDPAFVLGCAMTFVLFLGIPSFFFLMTLFMQFGLGFSPIHAGVTAIPYAVGTIAAAGASPTVVRRVGKASIYAGCALLAAGMFATARLVTSMGPASSGASLWVPLLVCGLGVGSAGVPVLNIILASMRQGESGGASGLVTTAQQIGGAAGVAVAGMLMFGIFGSHAARTVDGQVAAIRHQLRASGVPAPVVPAVLSTYRGCFARAARGPTAALPPACDPSAAPGGPASPFGRIDAVLARYGAQARSEDFAYVAARVLTFNIAVFLLALVMACFMPKPDLERISADPLLD